MKFIPLPSDVTAMAGFTHKVVIEYTDLTAAAGAADTTVTLPIVPQDVSTSQTEANPAGLAVLRTAINLVTPFVASDGSVNSLLLEIGDGGDTDRLLTQTEVAVAGTEVLFKVSAATTQPYAYVAADTIDALFTIAGGASPTIDELTSGKVEIYFHLVDLNQLENV